MENMQLILPKTFYDVPEGKPVYFLMGPSLGGDDWQYQACKDILKHDENPIIAAPCKYGDDHPLAQFRVKESKPNVFRRQTIWERYYIMQALKYGCVICWLPSESKSNPRADGNPYARDTLGEIGEMRGHLIHNPSLHFVLGAEPDFPGLNVMLCNFTEALGPAFRHHTTLEATVRAAVARTTD